MGAALNPPLDNVAFRRLVVYAVASLMFICLKLICALHPSFGPVEKDVESLLSCRDSQILFF